MHEGLEGGNKTGGYKKSLDAGTPPEGRRPFSYLAAPRKSGSPERAREVASSLGSDMTWGVQDPPREDVPRPVFMDPVPLQQNALSSDDDALLYGEAKPRGADKNGYVDFTKPVPPTSSSTDIKIMGGSHPSSE